MNRRTFLKAEALLNYGTYRITAQLPSGQPVANEVHWERGKKNRFELTT